MSWSIGYDDNWKRDIGYGVPAVCDHPGCTEEIDRGLSYVCGSTPYGGEHGCGLFFCAKHRHFLECADGCCIDACERCLSDGDLVPFEAKPDVPRWLEWKLTDESWQEWRNENPAEVAAIRVTLGKTGATK